AGQVDAHGDAARRARTVVAHGGGEGDEVAGTHLGEVGVAGHGGADVGVGGAAGAQRQQGEGDQGGQQQGGGPAGPDHARGAQTRCGVRTVVSGRRTGRGGASGTSGAAGSGTG